MHGLSPIGEEKEKEPESCTAAAATRGADRLPFARTDRQAPAQRASRSQGVAAGWGAERGSASSDLPTRPAGVPLLNLSGVTPAHGMSQSAREPALNKGKVDGSSSARAAGDESMKNWLMMPTYTDTPRTTRSTLEQIPGDSGLLSPRSSAGGGMQPSDAQEESPTVLPLHDEPDAKGGWPLGDWQQQVPPLCCCIGCHFSFLLHSACKRRKCRNCRTAFRVCFVPAKRRMPQPQTLVDISLPFMSPPVTLPT